MLKISKNTPAVPLVLDLASLEVSLSTFGGLKGTGEFAIAWLVNSDYSRGLFFIVNRNKKRQHLNPNSNKYQLYLPIRVTIDSFATSAGLKIK